MPAILNPVDFIKVGLVAFAFIWMANRGLKKVGLERFGTCVN